MSNPIAKDYGPRIDAFRWCKNGQMPDVRLLNLVAHAQNRVHAYRKKCVFNTWDASYSGSGTTQHRFRFLAGEGTRAIDLYYGVGLASNPSSAPYVTFSINASGGSTSSQSIYYGQAQTAGSAPSSIQWGKRSFTISPNTTYEVSAASSGQASLWALCAYERGYEYVTDEVSGYVDTTSAYGQIDDITRYNLLGGMSTAWKHNGAHLYNWSCNGTAATVTGATWTNPIDATTAVASTSAGVILGSSLLTPYSRRVQPLKARLCVYGQVTGGAGTGEVRLYSDSGSGTPTFATVTGIGGTLQWTTSQQTIPSGGDALSAFSKVDLQHRMNGAGTFNLYAVSLYLEET